MRTSAFVVLLFAILGACMASGFPQSNPSRQQEIESHNRKAAEYLKGRSDANHARRAAGQSQTAPKGVTTAVPRSVVPGNVDKSSFTDASGVFDPMKASKYLSSILPR